MEGNCKGAIFQGNIKYVLKKHGQIGLQKVMDEMKANGYRLNLDDIKGGHWYPLETRMKFLETTSNLFELDNEQLILLGRSGFKQSSVAQYDLMLANTPEKIFEVGPKVWGHNYDVGYLEEEYNGPSGSYFRVYDFDAPEIFFIYLIGYYTEALESVGAYKPIITHKKIEKDGKKGMEYFVKWR